MPPGARTTAPLLFFLVLFLARPGLAQPPTGTVVVRVMADSAPIAQVLVRIDRTGAITGDDGIARLTVSPGARLVRVARFGFRPDSITVTVVRDSVVHAVISLTAATEEVEEIVVTSTRGERRIEDEPVRVEVLGGGDVAEKTQMRPSDLTKLLTEMVGVRMQQAGGALTPTRIRLQGLRGQYTGLLADGLPLFGGLASGFSVLQLAPVDLAQVEVIKGAATSLYGPSALGGVVNLVSRRPARTDRLLELNQTSRGGTDAILWAAERPSPTVGLSLTAEGHRQTLADVDGDGWADLPAVRRLSLRPRVYLDRPNGDGLFATFGALFEDRDGGYLPRAAGSYVERLESRRVDAGAVGRLTLSGHERLTVKVAAVAGKDDRRFGDAPERNRTSTLYVEASYAGARGSAGWILGAAWQRDQLTANDATPLDYRFSVPALFGQLTVDPTSWLAASVSGRCDAHNVYGTICSPRVSILTRPTSELTARASAGLGFFGPTPFTDETEALGLRRVDPGPLEAERAATTSLDLSWHRGELELSATVAASRLSHPVELVEDESAGRSRLVNALEPGRVFAGELFAVLDAEPIVVTAFYGYLRGTELDLETGRRRPSTLLPRHSLGLDLAWESESTWIALEAFFTGRQSLVDNPYRETSRPYTVAELLISQRVGPARLYLNADNLFDVRQTRVDPLLLPAVLSSGRRTVTPWGPIEGRLVSVGTLVEF